MTTRVTDGARRERHFFLLELPPSFARVSWLPRSMLSRACTSLTNSEEKERLLAFYKKHGYTLDVYSRYVPSNYLISWDSRDCNLKKGAFGRSEVMRVTIGVYDLVGAPLCRIALYCFRDAVYCETTNARDWVKLHIRNSRTSQLDKNTDTLSRAT